MDSDTRGTTAGMERERTFQFDEGLPSLPVPDLEDTLEKYLDSVKPVTTDEEYAETERVVAEFRSKLGPMLHAKLLDRADERKNWLEEWWRDKVYLSSRTPLGVSSMYGANRTIDSFWPPCLGTDVERGAISTWYLLRYWQEMRKESIPVTKSKTGNTVFSMDQLRYVLNGSREPGVDSDKLLHFFKTEREGSCPNHIVVSCNGHIFRVDPFDSRGRLIKARDFARQLQFIKDRSPKRGQSIPTLTCDERTRYAKNIQHLKSLDPLNAEHIHTIDTSIVLLAFNEATPSNYNELFQETLSGNNAHNHWLDKSYIMMVFANGTLACAADHAPADAMVSVAMSLWGYQKMMQDGGGFPEWDHDGDFLLPTELVFVTDSAVQDAIVEAKLMHHKMVDNVEILTSFYPNYGKDWCKQNGMHPDFVCQLAIQLAYYRIYGSPTATYETATTRQYYHGRTETCRSCTSEALAWCKSMMDPTSTKTEQAALLKEAYDKHFYLMSECLQNRGCDRHLLGLYFISAEMGLPVPEIFMDQGFIKSGGGGNFTLSTSLSGYTPFLGLVAPMCQDGYFLSYRIMNDKFEFCSVKHRNSSVTDNHTMLTRVAQAMTTIQELATHAASKL